jgi:hypothetical protein
MSETSIDLTTENINDLLKEFDAEEKYRILFNLFIETLLRENVNTFFEKDIIRIHKDKVIDLFFSSQDGNELLDRLDLNVFSFLKEAIVEHPEYFIEVSD